MSGEPVSRMAAFAASPLARADLALRLDDHAPLQAEVRLPQRRCATVARPWNPLDRSSARRSGSGGDCARIHDVPTAGQRPSLAARRDTVIYAAGTGS